MLSAAVIALIVIAAAGFGLYVTKPSVTATSTEVMTAMEASPAMAFIPAPNVMMAEGIRNGYLVVAPLGNGNYSVEIHAEGLEPTTGTGNIYIVEGQQKSGTMASGPIIAQSAHASEFEVGSDGIGQYFVILTANPATSFESVQLVFLGGMSMGNATVIATATF
ncbi:MAG: hypothetical protein KGI38_00920 [Thaumarchaeota archaeon]|nr:hypothetical protein [Nitrososphaerota archaeon]